MGLFGLGKKKGDMNMNSQQQSRLQNMDHLPTLPEFPALDDDLSMGHDQTMADIKREVGKGISDDMTIPLRNPGLFSKTMASASVEPMHDLDLPSDLMDFDSPSVHSPSVDLKKRSSFDEDKPLFIRIDNYKKAIMTLDLLKQKLNDAEDVLKELDQVRVQEEQKLETWKKNIQSVKEKLLFIDKELFEV